MATPETGVLSVYSSIPTFLALEPFPNTQSLSLTERVPVPTLSTHKMHAKPQQSPLFKGVAPTKIPTEHHQGLQHSIGQLLSL